ncbi:MAG: protein TolQ [Nitrospinota bacterium]
MGPRPLLLGHLAITCWGTLVLASRGEREGELTARRRSGKVQAVTAPEERSELVSPSPPISIAPGHNDTLGLVLGAGPMVQFVLLVLLFFSMTSWAIIFYKWRVLRRARLESEEFLARYREERDFEPLYEWSKDLLHSPVAQVFRAGYREVKNIAREGNPGVEGNLLTAELTGVESVGRSLRREASQELSRLERALTFLATTGSVTPFIGLFGTVWGIMNSFREIGRAGSAGLAVVAPGIGEALIATAFGLAAAIPAVIAYNHYLHRVRALGAEMESFSAEFLNIVERTFLRK